MADIVRTTYYRLLQLIRTHYPTLHAYADDTQILGIGHQSTTDELYTTSHVRLRR